MKNLANIKKVLDHIEANPHLWDQNFWHCGTSHCFAGWAEVFATGETQNDLKTRQVARMFFGFSAREADYYFDPARTLADLKTALEPFFDQNGWGRDGYHRNGYDRDGYDRYGYDRWGYDQEGYDQDGYDREGFNRNGYDRDGYDRDGYNCYGYHRAGYDRDGYDRDGLDRNNQPRPLNL